MIKKKFKVILSKQDGFMLDEPLGYFTWLNDLRVFIYNSSSWRRWYVIDLNTGLSFASGESMASAKLDAFNKMKQFEKYKETDAYKAHRFMYQKLLREEKERECKNG